MGRNAGPPRAEVFERHEFRHSQSRGLDRVQWLRRPEGHSGDGRSRNLGWRSGLGGWACRSCREWCRRQSLVRHSATTEPGQAQRRRGGNRAGNRRSQRAGTLGARQRRRRSFRTLREITAMNRLVHSGSHDGYGPHRPSRSRNRFGHSRLGDGVPGIRDHGGNRRGQRERSHHWLQCIETGEGDDSSTARGGNPLRRRCGGERHPCFVRRTSRRHRVWKIDREHGQLRIWLPCEETAAHGGLHEPFGCRRCK